MERKRLLGKTPILTLEKLTSLWSCICVSPQNPRKKFHGNVILQWLFHEIGDALTQNFLTLMMPHYHPSLYSSGQQKIGEREW